MSSTATSCMAVIAESWKADGRLAKPGVVATVMSNLGLERYLGTLGLDARAHARSATATCSSTCASTATMSAAKPSGHIILSDYATTGDGLVAALQVLAVVKKQDKPVSQVCHRFEPLPQVLQERPLQERQAAGRRQGPARHQERRAEAQRPRPAGDPALRHRAGDPGDGRGRRQGAGRGGGRRHRRGADRRRCLALMAACSRERRETRENPGRSPV